MRGELEIFSFETQDADPVDSRHPVGGNLAMVASLLGTPYACAAASCSWRTWPSIRTASSAC